MTFKNSRRKSRTDKVCKRKFKPCKSKLGKAIQIKTHYNHQQFMEENILEALLMQEVYGFSQPILLPVSEITVVFI